MKTTWDYSSLATAYLKRPDYSSDAISKIFTTCGVKEGQDVCDVGAGVAHLTLHLLKAGLNVVAVEPNDNMRLNGIERTKTFPNVSWQEATGEDTNQKDSSFDFVTFGSSFNVTDRSKALQEVYRILRPKGWFTCMWNHRILDDPIQATIEKIISSKIHGYDYGSRREDQTEVITASGLFINIEELDGTIEHSVPLDDAIEAWRSHGTLQRQAGDMFLPIVDEIEEYLRSLNRPDIAIPYRTRAWVAQRKD